MTGTKHVKISKRHAKFEFELHRNITIVRGDSGTGKTTVFNMVADHAREGDKSGIQLRSDAPCVALNDSDWANQLLKTKDSIVFIDEDCKFVSSHEFAKIAKGSSCYFVIFTRENLFELPYSVHEIYEIKSSGKFHKFSKLY